MSDRYTIRDGIVYGISRDPKKGTEFQGLMTLIQSDPQALADLMNLCHCEGKQVGMADARKIVFGTPDGELAVAGSIENILTGKGGPINAAQAAELAGLPDNDDHFDDCPMGVGGECDCEGRIVSRLLTPEEQDAADAAEIARDQDAQVRRTTAATKARVAACSWVVSKLAALNAEDKG